MQEQLENKDEIEIDLLELAQVLWRKAWLIILCFIIGAGAAGGVTKFFIVPQYSASSIIYVMSKTTNISSLNLSLNAQLTSDFLILSKTRPVIERVRKELDFEISYDDLLDSVVVTNPNETQLLEFTATNADPVRARDIANAMSEAVSYRIAEVMDTDKPNIAEEAVTPEYPSSPHLWKNTVLGGILAAFFVIGILVVRYLMDDTIKDEDDVEKYLGLNTLAAFPEERKKKRKGVA